MVEWYSILWEVSVSPQTPQRGHLITVWRGCQDEKIIKCQRCHVYQGKQHKIPAKAERKA